MRRSVWAAVLVVSVALGSSVAVAHVFGFADVPGDHGFEPPISWLRDAGITKGCNPPVNDRFCPDDAVTRGEMAAFLVRSLGLVGVTVGDRFVDDNGSVFEADIEKIAHAGITLGCNPPVNDRFCPDDLVTRGEMAAFLYRALYSTPYPIVRLSRGWDGSEANSGSHRPVTSADGRYVAFWSVASNLVPGDTNGVWDVFVYDRVTSTTTRASVASDGSEANSGSYRPVISADGRYVVFESVASNLVPGDTNGVADVFVHDAETSETTRVSVSSTGVECDIRSWDPAISGNGRYVVFVSGSEFDDTVLSGPGVYVRDLVTGQTDLVVAEFYWHEPLDPLSISDDGRYVLYGNSLSGHPSSVYWIDRESTDPPLQLCSSRCGGGSMSSDGRYVAYYHPDSPSGRSAVYRLDVTRGVAEQVSPSEGASSRFYHGSSISPDGNRIAFIGLEGYALAFVHVDVWVHTMSTGLTERVARSSSSDISDVSSSTWQGIVSAGDTSLAFSGGISYVVPDDHNLSGDVFVVDLDQN